MSIGAKRKIEEISKQQELAPYGGVEPPPEILKMIFSYLSADLKRAAQVCHHWKDNVNAVIQQKDKEALKKYGAFGAAEWAEYFGLEVKAPPIPRGIFAWLDRPSVKTEGPDGKKGETGLLFLMPEGISLNSMEKSAQKAIRAWKAEYNYPDDEIRNRYGKNSVGKSYWVWMSKALLLNSRKKTYEKQKSMVKDLGDGYELPEALEAVVLNIAWYVSHEGQRLFCDNPWTYTRCQEVIEVIDDRLPLVVGGFFPGGLPVSYSHFVLDAAARTQPAGSSEAIGQG